jgi:putative ATP-dependent endonuclease of the OLD family
MYISKVTITNFRSFQLNTVLFNPGINVIIGHNNAGKTNLLKALQLVFDRSQQKLSIDDFNAGIEDFFSPPCVTVSVTLTESLDDVKKVTIGENPDDKTVIYDWIISEEPPYTACLTYQFFLPIKHHEEYKKEIEGFKISDNIFDKIECRKVIERKFLRKYVSAIYGGDLEKEEKVTTENLDRFDFQFLDAIRDAERQMFYGNNTLLRDVLNYFLDYDLTEGKDFELLADDKKALLKARELEFNVKAGDLLKHLIGRISKQEILAYSSATGADRGGKPDFDGQISEKQLLFVLRLIVEKLGFKLPIKNNGLGYNNLLFIALIMAKMQMESSSFMGENAKVFPILAIEEPEAHLHPSMQYKFLKFLDQNIHNQRQARQAFISTHSTQITAAVDLDSIICLYEDFEGHQRVSYPGRVFSSTAEDQHSKRYVHRFLDATKSNMLFADRVIFVEGIAEQLLLPCFAAYLESEELLTNSHTAIISVDSRTFKHFLKLFLYKPLPDNHCLRRKVVCITDADPSRKQQSIDDEEFKRNWKSCYPFELNMEPLAYKYLAMATHASDLRQTAKDFDHIRISTPIEGIGKTLEYELAHCNPSCSLLLTECFPTKGKNKKELLKQMMAAVKDTKEFTEISAICLHDDIINGIKISNWKEDDKTKALIAACYHRAVENAKGEHAFLLEEQLRQNLSLPVTERLEFAIPKYLKDSIMFITDQL